MSEYPAHLARERRLADGRMVMIRPIRPDDEPRERAFLNGLSEESWYLRFQKWVTAPSDRLVHFLTRIDYDQHMAFVCTVTHDDAEQLVGEARYVVQPGGESCDFGIMIADAWHKTGIAGLLMEALIGSARERGLQRMEGLVLSNNLAMLRFARALGFEVRSVPDDIGTRLIIKALRAGPERGATCAPRD